MKLFLFVFVSFMIVCCNSDELSLKIGKLNVVDSSKRGLYFYRVVNGLSTDAYFLSMKNDISRGFNNKEDFYFMVIDPLIYYKVKTDTVFIYTGTPAIPPAKFGFIVVQKSITALEEEQYEKMYKNNEIKKVVIDSIYTPDCNVTY
ncbi:hypothetical protein A3860_13100 [Niastella vici]|uniref:Uncharacterized protein n=1 Tax=Niastella vici TaxID=1703345 RepID=A0A1V9G730_9BACT|nr:hypothetical protein [Niastella vici]OQP66423.1 hypothetical protein A3860_13100 [Niastella vici]